MLVEVIASVNEARSDLFVNKTAIVIDVLRATSTMITALARGCSGVVPVETVHQAKSMMERDDLLGGERYGKKIAGFDFGNSPLEYRSDAVLGRKIILTTTNGTRAIQKAQKAAHVLAGAMINAELCAQTAVKFKRDVVILCSGTQNEFSLEDGLCAGLIIDELSKHCESPLLVNDFGTAMHLTYLQASHMIPETIMQCTNGKRLCKLGFREDVHYCAQSNIVPLVPVLRGETMQPFTC